jgi:hypothetical protein
MSATSSSTASMPGSVGACVPVVVPGSLPSRSCAAASFFDTCTDPQLARIMLLDAPSVLGWERWSEISNQHNMGLVQALLSQAIAAGRIPPQPIAPLAHTLLGALREAALHLARADDHTQARADVGAVMDRLIQSLVPD